MINVASIQAFDDEWSGVAKVLTYLQGLLIDILCCKVLSHTTVIRVTQLCLVNAIVEQIVHIDIVNIAVNLL